MAQPIGLHSIPDYVLKNIMAFLPLNDLKAVSCTSKRLSALASSVIVGRKNVALCLNALRPHPVRGTMEMQVINPQFFTWFKRQYTQLAVDCGPHFMTTELMHAVQQLPICWEIQSLYITGEHPLVVNNFIQLNQSILSYVTDMTVCLDMKYGLRNTANEMVCVMPELRTLRWLDNFRHSPLRPTQKLDLFAPKLQKLALGVSYGCSSTLSMASRQIGFDPAVGYYSGFQVLTELRIVLCWDTWIALRSLTLPRLQHLDITMMSTMSPCQDFWRLFARRMPNLGHLRVTSCNEMYRLRLFISCPRLETVELVGGRIEIEQDVYQEVPVMRKLCLFGCVLSDECGTVKFCRLESLCLVSSWRKQLTWTNQDWLVPNLRYLCIESPNDVGINLRNCHHLEVFRTVVTEPILILPFAMTLSHLTVFQLECRWVECGDQVASVLSRAPNLRHLQMLVRGCKLDYLEHLPRWCPRITSFILLPDGNHSRALVLKHQTLKAEIVLGTMLVYFISPIPIVVPSQVETLILLGILCKHHEPTVIRIDLDHPCFDAIRMHSINTQNWRVLMVNADRHQAHMRWKFSCDPFGCEHIKKSFQPWLATNDPEPSTE
ncbi:hypothetical protein ZHAS_00010227 [Anopheles sinensis]|uniref:F-box domain-containing protein n=1 Tax=Anopheles sinensis TaxID=74873 RepID=A0A084VX25_ANOSI|nr:hypothetical protein ZHAS_00010227 [Anopheles sinensis]